jgi:ABC-2 type transport system permease protein
MIRLFLIEWIKLRKYRAFYILTGLYFIVVGFVCSGGNIFLNYLSNLVNKGAKITNVDPKILPIYEFPDVWQNITFIAIKLKIILAFIVIISLTNEITYKTFRQNIIDGLNRAEFMVSKISMIFVLALANTILVFLIGLVNGLFCSHNLSIIAIFSDMQFLGAFFLDVFVYLILAFLIGLLIKRTGIAIVFLGIYAIFIEPIATLIFTEAPKIPAFLREGASYFPIKALRDVIPNPFPKYIFQEFQDYIAFSNIAIISCQLIIYLTFIYMLLKWRNNT